MHTLGGDCTSKAYKSLQGGRRNWQFLTVHTFWMSPISIACFLRVQVFKIMIWTVYIVNNWHNVKLHGKTFQDIHVIQQWSTKCVGLLITISYIWSLSSMMAIFGSKASTLKSPNMISTLTLLISWDSSFR